MSPAMLGLSRLSNPLATPDQLFQSASQREGLPREVEDAARYHASCAIQAVGILLRLPQPTVAETIIIFCRFWVGSAGGSMLSCSVKDVAVASLYLITKCGPYPLSPKQILNAFSHVIHVTGYGRSQNGTAKPDTIDSIPLYTAGDLEADRAALLSAEARILQTLGFQTHVALPHCLLINYLQTLGAIDTDAGQDLARRAYAHLNTALLSPQLLYLTHQPSALAAAAIYIAAREIKIHLSDEPWWEIFDVDREDLGFLAVALTSMGGFAEDQATRPPPSLTTDGLRELIVTSQQS